MTYKKILGFAKIFGNEAEVLKNKGFNRRTNNTPIVKF